MYFRFTGDSIVSTLCLLLWEMFRSLETLFNDHCRCIFFISRCDLILNWDSFHLYQSFLNAEELSLDRLTGGPSHSIRVRESTAIYRLGCNKKKKKKTTYSDVQHALGIWEITRLLQKTSIVHRLLFWSVIHQWHILERVKTYPPQLKSVLLLAVKYCDLEHRAVKEKRPFSAFFPIFDLKHGAVKKNRPFSAFFLIFDFSSSIWPSS